MIFVIICLLLTILWIVLGTSWIKIHPFFVLFTAALFLGILLGLPLMESLTLLQRGFGQIIEKIGLLILFGTVIGVSMERSGATLAIAQGILHSLSKLPLPYALSCIGYLVSIPVFCDAAFVILSHLNKTLSQQTKTPLIGLTVALSTGLFAPHVLVPPTPGPLAAAANLELENLILLIVFGGVTALLLVLVGGTYGYFLTKRMPYTELENTKEIEGKEMKELPSFFKAILPILVPIVLMCFGTIVKLGTASSSTLFEIFYFITSPTMALGIGMLFAFLQSKKNNTLFINQTLKKGIEQAAPILIITGMGGALGSIIQTIPLKDYAVSLTAFEGLGILIPFLIAALLKTAQGSSTVAIITTSSIIFPLLPLLGLDSEMGKVWAILALGVGSMTVSHANDSYFWIVTQMGGLDVKSAFRSHTVGTLLQGLVGLGIVWLGFKMWQFL
ncbi:MAG: GntP family permease [Flavobacteriaceae bacterium]|jgi:GntP family gluconate:H+ symporter